MQSFKKMVRSALYEVRRIIYDLRPMALDDLGLVPTLRKYLQTIEEYHKHSKITFISIGEEKRLPAKYEVALFRMIQESVQNALKHANACEIKVNLEMTTTSINVTIKDNGVGFDIAQKKKDSFGIIGMRERVHLLDGEISIASKIGNGTTVSIIVPLINLYGKNYQNE
jgi:two-component system sensor histidine kinase DegS